MYIYELYLVLRLLWYVCTLPDSIPQDTPRAGPRGLDDWKKLAAVACGLTNLHPTAIPFRERLRGLTTKNKEESGDSEQLKPKAAI
jgi:hypothetical protein